MNAYRPELAARVHFATDNDRISALAEAMYRQRHGGTAEFWRSMTLDDQRALRMEARDWIRAAVAAGILPLSDEALRYAAELDAASRFPAASPLSDTPLAVAFGTARPLEGCSHCGMSGHASNDCEDERPAQEYLDAPGDNRPGYDSHEDGGEY